jgi:putative PIN family toxin of toxin-antitoxin system
MELARVLAYPKFQLASRRCMELFSLYVSCCETIDLTHRCPVLCRDPKDQQLLDLAHSGNAGVLVTGDDDLLALAGQTAFVIEAPGAYRSRVFGENI